MVKDGDDKGLKIIGHCTKSFDDCLKNAGLTELSEAMWIKIKKVILRSSQKGVEENEF